MWWYDGVRRCGRGQADDWGKERKEVQNIERVTWGVIGVWEGGKREGMAIEEGVIGDKG